MADEHGLGAKEGASVDLPTKPCGLVIVPCPPGGRWPNAKAICYDRIFPGVNPNRFPRPRSASMSEIWLHTNRRAIAFALLWPAIVLALGVSWLLWRALVGLAGWALVWPLSRAGLGCCFCGSCGGLASRGGDELLFYLRTGSPLPVPLALVEGFLLGQGPSYLRTNKPDASQASTVVVRLADRATEFSQRDVKPALGSWCNHYVTIRGTWCEPLSVPLVNELNHRLAEAQGAANAEGDIMATRLLVSMREMYPKHEALAAGADLIDMKEPLHGALGAVDAGTMQGIVAAVAGRVPISAALGELHGPVSRVLPAQLPKEVSFAKFGLAGCAGCADWPALLKSSLARLPAETSGVAVIYADWFHAGAPDPAHVLSVATQTPCRAVLVDTWDKSRRPVVPLVARRCARLIEQIRARAC